MSDYCTISVKLGKLDVIKTSCANHIKFVLPSIHWSKSIDRVSSNPYLHIMSFNENIFSRLIKTQETNDSIITKLLRIFLRECVLSVYEDRKYASRAIKIQMLSENAINKKLVRYHLLLGFFLQRSDRRFLVFLWRDNIYR